MLPCLVYLANLKWLNSISSNHLTITFFFLSLSSKKSILDDICVEVDDSVMKGAMDKHAYGGDDMQFLSFSFRCYFAESFFGLVCSFPFAY